MGKIKNLLNQVAIITNKNQEILNATGGRFNIFKVIGVTTAETRLHSAFLSELLNVKGSHGLKDKPLKAFIRICLDLEFDFETVSATTEVECFIGNRTETTGGRIDILIKDAKNRAIIIENKIYAGDQENQMLRYDEHSKSYTESRLIYLSLDGLMPSEYSTGGKEITYITLSYKFDIINWLTECKQQAVDFPLVREAISHYINLLKQLTNTSYMNEMNNEIISLVMQSPENMQNAFELEKVLTDVRVQIQWKFWIKLKESLKKMGIAVIGEADSKTVKLNNVEGYYKKSRIKDDYFGLWSEIYSKNGITIHWGCEVHENIYFGFTIEKEGKGGISNLEDVKAYRKIVKDCNEGYIDDSPFWLGWMYSTPKLDFRNFNTQAIFSLADNAILEKVTNQIAEQAVSDIKFVLDQINKI